jgi:hypothetical protein
MVMKRRVGTEKCPRLIGRVYRNCSSAGEGDGCDGAHGDDGDVVGVDEGADDPAAVAGLLPRLCLYRICTNARPSKSSVLIDPSIRFPLPVDERSLVRHHRSGTK